MNNIPPVSLYHRVPPAFEPPVLYPLNTLKAMKPHLYDAAVEKYQAPNRQHIMDCEVPPLKCMWNDVLHFSLVHPSVIRRAFNQLGHDIEFDSFELDTDMLDPEQTAVYYFRYLSRKEMYTPGNFVPYSHEAVPALDDLPTVTKEYYAANLTAGKDPLLYVGVPHILYKGAVDVGGLAIVHS